MPDIAGQLRDVIRIDEREEVDTPLGRQDTTWTEREIRWGRLVPLSVANRAELGQIGFTRVTHRVYFRGSVTLAPDSNRLVIRGSVFRPLEATYQDPQGRFSSVLVEEQE